LQTPLPPLLYAYPHPYILYISLLCLHALRMPQDFCKQNSNCLGH
jgi:hypothetical protein